MPTPPEATRDSAVSTRRYPGFRTVPQVIRDEGRELGLLAVSNVVLVAVIGVVALFVLIPLIGASIRLVRDDEQPEGSSFGRQVFGRNKDPDLE
jgi:hypothetical protein